MEMKFIKRFTKIYKVEIAGEIIGEVVNRESEGHWQAYDINDKEIMGAVGKTRKAAVEAMLEILQETSAAEEAAAAAEEIDGTEEIFNPFADAFADDLINVIDEEIQKEQVMPESLKEKYMRFVSLAGIYNDDGAHLSAAMNLIKAQYFKNKLIMGVEDLDSLRIAFDKTIEQIKSDR